MVGTPSSRRSIARRVRRRGATSLASVLAIIVGGLLGYLPASASADSPANVTVRATASPASGATVDPGTTITYTLDARSQHPPAPGATVVDDLSGLLANATVATSKADLSKQGLALDAKTGQLTWTLRPAGAEGPSGLAASTSFKATVAADAPAGTKLTTAAAPGGSTCSAGQPCATTLTVAGAPARSTSPTATKPSPTSDPSPSATPSSRPSNGTSVTATPSTPSSAKSTATKGSSADPSRTSPKAPTKAATKALTPASGSPKSPAAKTSPADPRRTRAAAVSPLDLPATCAAGTIFNINGNPLGTSGSSTAIGNIYALNTATGLNVPIGRFFGPGGPSEGAASSTGLNALAVTPSLSFAYAVTQSATGTRTIYTHARNGTNTTQSAGTAGSGTTVVMGAFDPDNGVYYYAGYSGSGTSRELVIFGYNPALTGSARVLGRVATVSFSTAGTGGQTFETGDMAFDANGNLFVVAGTNFTAAANTSQIRRVNGPFPTTPQATPQSRPSTTLATNEAGEPGTGFYNGIAFAPDGTLYAQYTTGTSTLVDLNPNTGNRLFVRPQSGVPSTGILTDLAGCSLPGTLTLEKTCLTVARGHPTSSEWRSPEAGSPRAIPPPPQVPRRVFKANA